MFNGLGFTGRKSVIFRNISSDYSEYSEYFRIFGRGFLLFVFLIFRKITAGYSEYFRRFRLFIITSFKKIMAQASGCALKLKKIGLRRPFRLRLKGPGFFLAGGFIKNKRLRVVIIWVGLIYYSTAYVLWIKL